MLEVFFNAEAQRRRGRGGLMGVAARWGQRALPVAALLWAMVAEARTVSTGTVVANPEATVSVPVTIDDVSDAGAAVVTIGYDSTVLVCLGVDAGPLAVAEKMTYLDSGNGRVVAIFSGFAEGNGALETTRPAELMRIRFSVRDGTQGLFSDVTLSDVQFGAKDGVSDLSAVNPLSVVNGMVRVMSSDAQAARLEESFTVWTGTDLKSLTLGSGDAIMAGEAPVRVSGAVVASGVISVAEPIGGWQTGRYAILSTPTEWLEFGGGQWADSPTMTVVSIRENGVTTYYADVVVEGSVEVVAESGELPTATAAQVRDACADDLAAHSGVTRILVKGDVGMVQIAADLGIAPAIGVQGAQMTAAYTTPTLRIVDFDHNTGRVRIKVTPGEGNTIRSALATGCIHVYGTSSLKEKMRYISGTEFDLTPYLQAETKGEADLTVSMGTHTFIKVKAECDVKSEGDLE